MNTQGASSVNSHARLRAAEAFRHAFGVAPEVADEKRAGSGLGIYGWNTPNFEGFKLPETDDLVIALHLGGSRSVRAVTEQGLSRSCSLPGMVTVLPPGRRAAFRTGGGIKVMTVHVTQPANHSSLSAHVAEAPAPLFAIRDGYGRACMEQLLRVARSSQAVSSDYAAKVADALLSHLSQWTASAEAPGAASSIIPEVMIGRLPMHEVIEYVDRNLGCKLSLDELAWRAGISRAAFTRSFKAALGVSAHQFITLRRVKAAERLLASSQFDLTYIAQETGFCSQSHFTENFRAITGVTPGRYRAMRS